MNSQELIEKLCMIIDILLNVVQDENIKASMDEEYRKAIGEGSVGA